jgi:hypothetical protein
VVAGQLAVAGSATSVTSSVAASQLPGTATNDAAAAGRIGEFLSALNTSGTTVTAGATTNLANISLTAGDWDVGGEVWMNYATTATEIYAAINTVSATLPGISMGSAMAHFAAGGGGNLGANSNVPLTPCRISIAGTTTVYLMADVFGGTGTGFGKLMARRAR